MTTSQTFTLSEPKGTDKVPVGTFAYFRARLKQRVYNLVIREFKKSGLSQADLARRLGMPAPQLNRILRGPGNLTLDSVSDVLFAINGGEPGLSTEYPLSARHETEHQHSNVQPIRQVNTIKPGQKDAPDIFDILLGQKEPIQRAA